MNRQPSTVVGSVLEDLYDFRSIIAHGQEVPVKPYRQKHDLVSTKGERINCSEYYYLQLMQESGLFMLTAALGRIFVEGLFDDVKDETKWRLKLRLYEHRYKDACGPAATNPRGR